jgi:prolyl-tRNA editing enzyme YbaK/EbsC (Cys-tRNA(Pro) deacylase)
VSSLGTVIAAGLTSGLTLQVQPVPVDTATARQTADALGCTTADIAKSLIFAEATRDELLLALVTGEERVARGKLSSLVGGSVHPLPASIVESRTGFSVGSVPPFGFHEPLPTYMSAALVARPRVFAGAGAPGAVLSLSGIELQRATRAVVGDIAD